MGLVRTAVERPISIVILCVTVILMAITVIPFIPRDTTPNIESPFISIVTRYGGASPSEIESSITKPIELVLANIEGVKNIKSISKEELSLITLEFSWNTNLETSTNNIRVQLDRVRYSLPERSKAPIIYKRNMNANIPVSSWTIAGNNLSPDELYKMMDINIMPYLERIVGVGTVSLSGGRKEKIHIDLIQNRLQAYKISIGEIRQILITENIQLGGGNIHEHNRKIALRIDGKLKTLEDIENVVVKTIPIKNSTAVASIRLRDLGNISLDYEDVEDLSYFNGQKSLSLNIFKRSGANAVAVSKAIDKVMKKLQKKMPPGIIFTKIWDSAIMIGNSLSQVLTSIMNGFLLTIIILIIFLRSIRSAAIVAITIPLSILATLVMMYFADLTLNIISLAGLNLGIGMIVDSSIVLLENTTRYREKGVVNRSAAILGCEEMKGAIITGSLTTICVFLPLVLFSKELGIIGALFKDMSFTIVISLATSLIFALITVPVLTGVLLPIHTTTQRNLTGIMKKIDIKVVYILNYLEDIYAKGIQWALAHKQPVLWSVVLSLILSFVIFANFVGLELMPPTEDDTIAFNYQFPPGTSLDDNISTINQSISKIQKIAGKGLRYTQVMPGSVGSLNKNDAVGEVYLFVPQKFKDRILSNTQIMSITRKVLSKVPNLQLNFESRGPTQGSAAEVMLNLTSSNQFLLETTSERIMKILQNVKSLTDVQTNSKKTLPEMNIIVDRDKAWEYGLSFQNIATELRNNFQGGFSGSFEYKGRDLDIWTVLRKEDRQSILDLEKIFFLNNKGMPVTLTSIAHFENSYSQPSILRTNQRREVVIFASSSINAQGKRIAASIANKDAFKAIRENIIIPAGVTMGMGGNQKDLMDLIPKVILVFFLSGFLVYAVMASQFENLKDPFIIIMSILTTPIGPSLFYFITQSTFSAYSMIGFIILSGIVVNHGIVLVDYTNLLRKRKMPLYEAVVLAGRTRLRPIMMTTLTTVLGMIPMAITRGNGTAMSQPIGQTVVAGMISSSILTLLFTPVFYYILNIRNEKKRVRQEEEKLLQLEQELAKNL